MLSRFSNGKRQFLDSTTKSRGMAPKIMNNSTNFPTFICSNKKQSRVWAYRQQELEVAKQ